MFQILPTLIREDVSMVMARNHVIMIDIFTVAVQCVAVFVVHDKQLTAYLFNSNSEHCRAGHTFVTLIVAPLLYNYHESKVWTIRRHLP